MTVTKQEAVLPPSEVVTVIVAVPGATQWTFPSEFTVATDSSLLVQEILRFVAFWGWTDALREKVMSAERSILVRLRETLSTGMVVKRP